MSETKKERVITGIGVITILSNEENETLKNIDTIKNSGVLIAREDFYSKYPNISLKGIGVIVLVPPEANVSLGMGVKIIDQGYLDGLNNMQHIVSMGALVVSPDTDAAAFTQKVSGISLMGAAICPERLVGTVSSLVKSSMYVTIPYPNDSDAKAVTANGHTTIDKEYIESLKENTVLIANGNLVATQPLEKELAKSKILHMLINGIFTISQENQDILSGRTTINGKTIVVPAGHEYISGDLKLDENNISNFSGNKVFTPETIIFGKTLTAEMINGSSLSFICSTAVYNKSIEKTLNTVLSDPDTKKIAYTGELLLNHGVRKITSKELEYSKIQLHLINYGDMDLSENIGDDTFFEKITGIHNFGSIKCSENLYGLVQSKMIENEGMIATFEEFTEKKENNEIIVMSGLGNLEL